MTTQYDMLHYFKTFIRDTSSGKRLKKNGEKIKPQSIQNYCYVLQNLIEFSTQNNLKLRIYDASRLTKREFTREKNYWKKFYKGFVAFMYKKGCHDNYVGSNIKCIRTFFNYLKHDQNISIGDFHKEFYVRKEEIEIFVLNPEQLKFLIHDKYFEAQLTSAMQRVKDFFVLGCSTGLRFSDMILLTNKNFETVDSSVYLKSRSAKTKTFSLIKLPKYAVEIIAKYNTKKNHATLFGKMSLYHFNKKLKCLGALANFTAPVNMSREKQGKARKIISKGNRFCDQMSSHMMRRTAITTFLILGMPEHAVKKISGHTAGSGSFNRYVHYAQAYLDNEIDKVHDQLST